MWPWWRWDILWHMSSTPEEKECDKGHKTLHDAAQDMANAVNQRLSPKASHARHSYRNYRMIFHALVERIGRVNAGHRHP
jgi:ribulose kinase